MAVSILRGRRAAAAVFVAVTCAIGIGVSTAGAAQAAREFGLENYPEEFYCYKHPSGESNDLRVWMFSPTRPRVDSRGTRSSRVRYHQILQKWNSRTSRYEQVGFTTYAGIFFRPSSQSVNALCVEGVDSEYKYGHVVRW